MFAVSADYYNLCSKTIDCYAQLQQKLNDPRVIEAMKGEVIIIFGPQRIGKSTFLARMASEVSTSEFKEEMSKTDEKTGVIIKMGDIEVASGNIAVTLVPNFHILNGQLIIDLAGCKDITENRRPIISLLNYCLLSKIPALKIISVIPLSSLLSNTIHESVNTYFDYYCDLLTRENVPGGLRSTVFIVTMVDKYIEQFSANCFQGMPLEAWFRYSIGEYNGSLGSRTPEVSQLSSCLQSNGILIDYTKGKEQIIQSVFDKLKRAETLNARLVRLDVGGVRNEIVSQCLVVTRTYIKMLETFTIRLKNVSTGDSQLSGKLLEQLPMIGSLKATDKKIIELLKRCSSIKEQISKVQAEREMLLGKLEELGMQIDEVKSQQLAFEAKYEGFSMLALSILTSTNREGQEKLYSEYIVRQGSVRPTELLIIDLDVFQDHQSEIYNCLTAEAVYALRLPVLPLDRRSSVTSAANRLIIQISMPKPFIVVLMDTVNVRETPLKPLFSANYGERLATLNDFVVATESKIQTSLDNLNNLQIDLGKTNGEIEGLKQKFLKDKETSLSIVTTICNDTESHGLTLDELKLELKAVQSNQILTITQEIGKVLKHSNLDGDVIKEIGRNEERMVSLLVDSDKVKTKINSTLTESRRFITGMGQTTLTFSD